MSDRLERARIVLQEGPDSVVAAIYDLWTTGYFWDFIRKKSSPTLDTCQPTRSLT